MMRYDYGSLNPITMAPAKCRGTGHSSWNIIGTGNSQTRSRVTKELIYAHGSRGAHSCENALWFRLHFDGRILAGAVQHSSEGHQSIDKKLIGVAGKKCAQQLS